MDFKFSIGSNNNLCLGLGSKEIEMGQFYLRLPGMFWLFYLHKNRKNIFDGQKVEIPIYQEGEKRRDSEEEMRKVLSDTFRLAGDLLDESMSDGRFNERTRDSGLSRTMDRRKGECYEFLAWNSLLNIETYPLGKREEGELIYKLSDADTTVLTKKYLEFASRELKLGSYGGCVIRLAKELKAFRVPESKVR